MENNIRSLYIGFDFWGHGNIGDDLMIAGFQKALALYKGLEFKRHIATPYFIESQKIRFPDISWHRELPYNFQDSNIGIHSTWVGLGDTPFQLTCGDYRLKRWLAQLPIIEKFNKKCLVNVGAELEIEPEKEKFSLVANAFDKISTRDQHSADVITKMLGVPDSKVYAGSDLANIILEDLIPKNKNIKKRFDLGVIIAGDTLTDNDLDGVKNFLMTRKNPVSFIAGDIRDIERHECYIYKQMVHSLWPWTKNKKKLVLTVPNYMTGSLGSLLSPIVDCSSVISSRYHGLLIAAWSGCRVAAIARSSKIPPLAKELRIPICYPPLTRSKLENMEREACIVSRSLLINAREKALKAFHFGMDI